MVIVYLTAVDIEDMCLHLLFTLDVSWTACRYLPLEELSAVKMLTDLALLVLVLHI